MKIKKFIGYLIVNVALTIVKRFPELVVLIVTIWLIVGILSSCSTKCNTIAQDYYICQKR